jgi:hypothetical protein
VNLSGRPMTGAGNPRWTRNCLSIRTIRGRALKRDWFYLFRSYCFTYFVLYRSASNISLILIYSTLSQKSNANTYFQTSMFLHVFELVNPRSLHHSKMACGHPGSNPHSAFMGQLFRDSRIKTITLLLSA